MNKKPLVLLAVLAAMGVLAGGVLFLGDEDSIQLLRGQHPPGMRDAAQEKALIAGHIGPFSTRLCVPTLLTDSMPERFGIEGVGFDLIPGRYAITYALKTKYAPHQARRDEQLALLDHLVKHGLLDARDDIVETADGPQAARTYGLTWKGYLHTVKSVQGVLPCLAFGQAVFGDVTAFSPATQKYRDFDTYRVTYRIDVTDVPAWLSAPEAKTLFPQLEERLRSKEYEAEIVRTGKDWRVSEELRAEDQAKAKGRTREDCRSRHQYEVRMPPPMEVEVRRMFNERIADKQQWSYTGSTEIHYQLPVAGHPDKRWLAQKGEYVIDYADEERDPGSDSAMRTTLNLAAAMEKVGKATLERLPPLDAYGRPAPQGGVRYRFQDEMIKFRFGDLTAGGGGFYVGPAKVEYLGMVQREGQWEAVGRTTYEYVPENTRAITPYIPALQVMYSHGALVTARLIPPHEVAQKDERRRNPDSSLRCVVPTDEGWKMHPLLITRPELHYSRLPEAVRPMLPSHQDPREVR